MSSSSTSTLTLPQLYARALTNLVPIFNDDVSTSSSTSQQILREAAIDLDLVIRMTSTLGVFSANESMSDVADGELVYMTVEWVKAEVQGKMGDGSREGIDSRLKTLRSSKVCIGTTILSLRLLIGGSGADLTLPFAMIVFVQLFLLPHAVLFIPCPTRVYLSHLALIFL
jgi:hypothetical protein